MPRFDGKVLMIDVGLSQFYGAHTACLVVEDGKPFALHRGNKVPLPMMPADIEPVPESDPQHRHDAAPVAHCTTAISEILAQQSLACS